MHPSIPRSIMKHMCMYEKHIRFLKIILHQYINPIDPNPAISARVVFPQSGRSRPEKRPFFHIFPHFSKRVHTKKYRSPVYQIKGLEMPCQTQKKL